MRILHVYKKSFPVSNGGIEHIIHTLCQAAAERGVRTDVLALDTCNKSIDLIHDVYSVHLCKQNFQFASTGISFLVFFKFLKLVKEVDIVHYHFPWPMMDLMHFFARVKKKSLITYHSDIVRQKFIYIFYKPLMYKFLDSVDVVVATSPQYVSSSKVLSKFRNKIKVIPLGIKDTSSSKLLKEKTDYWTKKFGINYFLFVGVLRYYKGLEVLIEAVNRQSYNLVIAGSGPLNHKLKKIVKDRKLNNIFFTGFVSEEDKNVLYSLSYAFVFPSHLRSEAFGVALLEAAMHSKALVSCDICTGTSFVNISNTTGIVIPPSNFIALRNALNYLWQNPNITNKMGKEARKRYLNYFTDAKMSESYFKLYDSLLNS